MRFLIVSSVVFMIGFAQIGPGSDRGAAAQDFVFDEVELEASDGVILSAYTHFASEPGARPILLLFHQGAHNARAEYAPLAPRLVEAGFDLVALDQRRGGDRFGGANQTVERLNGREFSYCDAYLDHEAALDYAVEVGAGAPVTVWGSSFSATLVLQLAAARPDDVSAVLAFSPASGEPMGACQPLDFATNVRDPVLILRPATEMEIPHVADQLEAFRSLGFDTHVADPGVHGSSMLNQERVGADTGAAWSVVLSFLAESR